jgi:tRNA(Arg) A34 adenosine deaminase TadA
MGMFSLRDYTILNQLKVTAIDVVPAAKAKVAAAVVVKNVIVSLGMNKIRSHPFQLRFGKNTDAVYWHAETNAIYNALKRVPVEDLTRASLYVVRVKKPHAGSNSWDLGLAKPCNGCNFCISTFGIKRVVYSTDSGYSELDVDL